MNPCYPNWLNETTISKALGESKIILNVSLNPAASKGDHFLSTILRAEVEYKNNDSDKIPQQTSFVLKTFPPGYLKRFIHENGILMKEINMYKIVTPVMAEVLGKNIAPKCFECSNEDVLILEDLRLSNFKSGDRINGLNFEQCTAAMKLLADFHGVSYILSKTSPAVIDSVKNEVQFTERNAFQKHFVNNCFKIVAAEVKNWPHCEKYSTKLYDIREKIWNQVLKEISPDSNGIMVLNHGDFWTNNIFFQYDNKNKITEAKLIDFQFCRLSTPAVDLQIFFTLSVRNKEFIPSLIDVYLSRLNELIQPQYLKKEDLLDALRRTECFGLVVSVCILPMILLDPVKVINIEGVDPEVAIEDVNSNPIIRVGCKDIMFKKVFPECLKHYDDIGLL